MIRKLALIALVLLLMYPVNAALIKIPYSSCDDESGNTCSASMLQNGIYDEYAWTHGNSGGTLRLVFSGGAYNVTYAKFVTHTGLQDPYGTYTPTFRIYTPNVTGGYCPTAHEYYDHGATGYSSIGSFSQSWDSSPKNYTRYGNTSDTLTGGRCMLMTFTGAYFGQVGIRYSELELWGEPVFEDPVTADFTGNPINGPIPLTVQLVDNSTGGPFTAYNWSGSGPGAMYFDTPTAANTSLYIPVAGNYTITHGVSSGSKSDIETKTDYIQVYNSTSMKTKYFQTIDGTNGNIVLNSSIQLEDIENASWTNATGLINDGMSSITTLTGHHINAYAQALGYSDSDDLNILNDGQPQYIMMWPTFAKNVSEGNVSLYVTVKDKDTKANIAGAGVTISPSVGSAQSTTTNAAGIAYFIVTNNTAVLVTAQAIGQGYQTATTTINTGTGSGGSAAVAATILLGKNTVTPTFPTVTTLPGGGTPAPTITILPGCEDQTSPEGQAKCRKAQSNQGLSFLSAHMLDLIMLCVFVTMMYLLGFKLGK